MNRTGKRLLHILIAVVLLAAIVIVGYYTLFHDTDILSVQDGKITGAKSTWLTGYSAAAEHYYKLADVSAPSGYSADKNAVDLDGNPLTTQFDFTKKDTSEGEIKVCIEADFTCNPQDSSVWTQTSLVYTGDRKATREYPDRSVLLKQKDTGDGWVCLLASPYSDGFIRISLSCPADFSEQMRDAELYAITDKITPGKQLHPFVADFKLNFLDDSRWSYLFNGLGITLLITLLSGCMGTVIGAIVASIRSTWQKNKENMHKGIGKSILKTADQICNVYLTVIRGTPVMVQLLIMYLIIFSSSSNGTVSAIVAFGINSGAYVAEIIRGGIMSIDNGQFEAGRSLGFNYLQTMWYIILPQVFKNILPTLANEFIALLKETSVCGYVAVKDLNKGGEIIRSVTYSPFLPLLAVAGIYLVLVLFFTRLVSILERRLRSSDH